tara:strand:+ start:458 stop:1357 length:900 start_codon:yes stop_codon:yes gene_type:complete
MPVTPPLDLIPQLPSKAVTELNKQSNKLIKLISNKVGETLQDVIQLPDDIKCDDPRIVSIKVKIKDSTELIGKLQEVIGVIEKVSTGLQTAMGVATAIKSAIFLIPVVGVAALQAELVVVQNMTIANAIQAVKQLNVVPQSLNAGMGLINNQLGTIISQLGGICNNDVFDVSAEVFANINSDNGNKNSGRFGANYNNPDGIGWGTKESRMDDATLGTEFYTDKNIDLDTYSEYARTIDELVKNQQDLLTSIQEAPAQSYNGIKPPRSEMGKSGDYYIDTAAKKMYGPKISTGWPEPVNY